MPLSTVLFGRPDEEGCVYLLNQDGVAREVEGGSAVHNNGMSHATKDRANS